MIQTANNSSYHTSGQTEARKENIHAQDSPNSASEELKLSHTEG